MKKSCKNNKIRNIMKYRNYSLVRKKLFVINSYYHNQELDISWNYIKNQ